MNAFVNFDVGHYQNSSNISPDTVRPSILPVLFRREIITEELIEWKKQ